MSEFTFLTVEQIFDNQLDIIKKYGANCAITDFSILLGGEQDNYTTSDNILGTGYWWTKSSTSSGDNQVLIILVDGYLYCDFANERTCRARPSLPFSSIKNISLNKVRGKNGILEVEYGEYPQDIVPKNIAKLLEKAYSNRILKQTGKTYTTDSVSFEDIAIPFKAREHIEYEYNGRKYIRFVGDTNCNKSVLSDGRIVKIGEVYWIEVKPIKWLVDEKANIALSKKILFSGVQFASDKNYKGDFDKTNIKKFMDKYFSKDIIPSTIIKSIQDKTYETELEKKSNPYGFNFSEVSEEDIIKGAIESGVAVFLHGKSSEGKSARVKQIDPNCVIIYLRNATPESLNGKSVYNSETGEMIDIKPTWLKKLEERCEKEPDKYHIVFFDEITNALPSIQGIAFNIILDKEVNGIWKLPKNARIVAAGNDMKDSLAANQLAEPLFNRFAHVYIETTTESWLKWASEHNIHPAIYAYIAYTNGESLRSKYDGEKPNADPRKWEMASKMLYATGRPEMLRALIGEDITREFCQFCNQRVITLEDVLNDNYTESDLQMNTSEIYATAMGLSQVDETNFEKVHNFILKLGAEPCALFESLWAHGDESRVEIIAETKLTNKKVLKKV